MIRGKFYYSAPEGSIHMTLRGHAGSAPRGRDPVCAAVSTLACTLGEAVERMYHQSMLRRCPRVELGSGQAEIIAVPKPEFTRDVLMAFWFAELGLCALEESYPACLALEELLCVQQSA